MEHAGVNELFQENLRVTVNQPYKAPGISAEKHISLGKKHNSRFHRYQTTKQFHSWASNTIQLFLFREIDPVTQL